MWELILRGKLHSNITLSNLVEYQHMWNHDFMQGEFSRGTLVVIPLSFSNLCRHVLMEFDCERPRSKFQPEHGQTDDWKWPKIFQVTKTWPALHHWWRASMFSRLQNDLQFVERAKRESKRTPEFGRERQTHSLKQTLNWQESEVIAHEAKGESSGLCRTDVAKTEKMQGHHSFKPSKYWRNR